MVGPSLDCASLMEVRENIDRLDRQIVTLLAERGAYVKQAARFKQSGGDVKAPARVEQVIGKVTDLAQELGADPQVVEQVYRAMIAAFIQAELSEYRTRERQASAEPAATESFRVDFAALPWQDPAPGVRCKTLARRSTLLRLLELTDQFDEADWCHKGHWGYLLEGELELITPEGRQYLTAGDGLFVDAGQPHKARVVGDKVRLILVEQA